MASHLNAWLVRSVFVGLVASVCLTAATPTWAAGDLTDAIRQLAKECKQALEKREVSGIAIGAFTGSADMAGTSATGIRLELSKQLEQLEFTISKTRYQAEIKGDFLIDRSDERNVQLRIDIKVFLQNGTAIGQFTRFVRDPKSVAEVAGIPAAFKPSEDSIATSEKVTAAIKTPPVDIAGSQVRVTRDSKFAVELLLRKTQKLAPVNITRMADAKNLPFAEIPVGESYVVRLHNTASHEVAVDVRIDGISSFEFSTLKVKPTAWIVPPNAFVDIQGWFETNTRTTAFKVVDFPSSAASKLHLDPSDTIGLITASFAASWEKDADMPHDEGTARGTGFGEVITTQTKSVTRKIGRVREIVTVRYERP